MYPARTVFLAVSTQPHIVCIYIYICRERERKNERKKGKGIERELATRGREIEKAREREREKEKTNLRKRERKICVYMHREKGRKKDIKKERLKNNETRKNTRPLASASVFCSRFPFHACAGLTRLGPLARRIFRGAPMGGFLNGG